jgi:hypothetical protein
MVNAQRIVLWAGDEGVSGCNGLKAREAISARGPTVGDIESNGSQPGYRICWANFTSLPPPCPSSSPWTATSTSSTTIR